MQKRLEDHIILAMILYTADNGHFDQMKHDMVIDNAKGHNTYPQMPDVLISFMNIYKTFTFLALRKVTKVIILAQKADADGNMAARNRGQAK